MTQPTYIPLPDWKENYEISLGDIIYDVRNPERALLCFRDSGMSLDKPAKPKKPLADIQKSFSEEKSRRLGLYAKIMEILSFGVNISHTGAGTELITYDIQSAESETFTPSDEFLEKITNNETVDSHLRNAESGRAFLITGILTGKGITYDLTTTKEHEVEGSVGIDVQGVSFGPSGKRARKKTIKEKHTVPGPSPFAIRVLKIQLQQTGKADTNEYTDGARFSQEDGDFEKIFGADLDEYDKQGMAVTELANEDGVQCLLVAPSV